MGKRIVIIQGHPDAESSHFGTALERAYHEGAEAADHEVRVIRVAALDFPLLRSKQDFEQGQVPPAIAEAQEAIHWCSHLVIVFPLWLGDMPALLKAFLEQVFRPGFGMEILPEGKGWKKRLKGRSSRIVVTMGMPAPVYRWYFGAHALKLLKRNILGFVGFAPVRSTVVGMVEGAAGSRERWLEQLRELGRQGG